MTPADPHPTSTTDPAAPAPVPPPHRRRTWGQRLLLALGTLGAFAALATATTLAYAKHRFDQMPRVELTASGYRPASELASNAPRNILLVGIDDASTLPAGSPEQAARSNVGGIRSDTIMLARLEPATKTARILSFPRDLWVSIPGHGTDKINAALAIGGPNLLVETLQADFGLEVNGYVGVDFAGFRKLVEAVDGVPTYFDTPVGDGNSKGSSGLHVTDAGCTTLDGVGALQYVRARHFYRVIDGRKIYDGTSDLGRIKRQQDFVQRLMERAIHKGARDPRKLASYFNIATEDITLDQGATAQDLLDLGAAFRQFDPTKLKTDTVPSTRSFRGAADGQDVLEQQAAPLLARFRTPAPGQFTDAMGVAVAVANGTGNTDEGAIYTAALAKPGFLTSLAADVPHVDRTEVRYPSGSEADAATVASFLDGDPTLVRDDGLSTVTVVTGPDLRGVRTTPRTVATPSTTTTSTTAPATTAPSTTGTSGTTSLQTARQQTAGYVPGHGPDGSC